MPAIDPQAVIDGVAFDVVLRDGSPAVLRPIRPSDKDRLADGLKRLSPQSRYLRFHTAVDHLNTDQLRYLTEIDYHDHMAWVALPPDDATAPGMGVARYVRLPDEPTVAEAAVTVLDEWQGRGLGTLLLAVLGISAAHNGVRTFRNYVLAENAPMLDIFEQLGGVRVNEGGGVFRVDVDLADQPQPTGASNARDVLRAAARGVPMRWLYPLVTVTRHLRADGDESR